MRYVWIFFLSVWFAGQTQAQEHFIGEIKAFPYNFVPRGFIACDGQMLKISEYNDLFKAIGNRYGGDGSTTFAVPDLNGAILVGAHKDLPVGTKGGGNETVGLKEYTSGFQHYAENTKIPTVNMTMAICVEGYTATSGGNTNEGEGTPPINTKNHGGKVALPPPPPPPPTVLATLPVTQPVWVTLLSSKQTLAKGKSVTHEKGSFIFQTDGNLVLYDKSKKPMWASATKNGTASLVSMEASGTLQVLGTQNGKINSLWSSNTRVAGAYLQVDWASYILRIVDTTGKELWRSKK